MICYSSRRKPADQQLRRGKQLLSADSSLHPSSIFVPSSLPPFPVASLHLSSSSFSPLSVFPFFFYFSFFFFGRNISKCTSSLVRSSRDQRFMQLWPASRELIHQQPQATTAFLRSSGEKQQQFRPAATRKWQNSGESCPHLSFLFFSFPGRMSSSMCDNQLQIFVKK